MDDKSVFPSKLPPGTQAAAKAVWDALPPADRRTLQELIEAFPSQSSLIQLLLRLAATEFKIAFGRKHRIAVVGPANVGKSTLYNQLIQRKEDRAEVGPLPGTTRANQQADAGLFTIVDTPGADAVGEVGQQEQDMALSAASEADFLVLMFDAIQGIKRTELELYERLAGLGKPYIVVMNKIDLVRRERQQIIETAAKNLRLQPDQIIPIAAKSGENLSEVLVAIAMVEPEIVAALGQALPQYRWQLTWRAIVSAASASAAVALAPLPVVDFIPLIALQSAMVLSIARIYNYEITLERARELAAAFGLGFLGRTLFRQLAKLGGVPGWVLSSAIATATTVVMGYAASIWFETGERVSSETLKCMTTALTQTLLSHLRALGKRMPSQQSLKQEIENVLRKVPGAENRFELEQTNTASSGSEPPPE